MVFENKEKYKCDFCECSALQDTEIRKQIGLFIIKSNNTSATFVKNILALKVILRHTFKKYTRTRRTSSNICVTVDLFYLYLKKPH